MMTKQEMDKIFNSFFGDALVKADKAIAEYEKALAEKEKEREELCKRWGFDAEKFAAACESISEHRRQK